MWRFGMCSLLVLASCGGDDADQAPPTTVGVLLTLPGHTLPPLTTVTLPAPTTTLGPVGPIPTDVQEMLDSLG